MICVSCNFSRKMSLCLRLFRYSLLSVYLTEQGKHHYLPLGTTDENLSTVQELLLPVLPQYMTCPIRVSDKISLFFSESYYHSQVCVSGLPFSSLKASRTIWISLHLCGLFCIIALIMETIIWELWIFGNGLFSFYWKPWKVF